MSAQELISFREYARRKGCDERAVRDAIRREYIVEAVVRPEGKKHPKIDPVLADQEWARHFDPSRAVNKQLADSLGFSGGDAAPAPAPAPVQAPAKERAPRKASAPSAPATEAPDPLPTGGPSIAKAKLKSEVHRAQLLELKYKQQSGELVKRSDVYRELYAFGDEIKRRLESIPDRIVDEVISVSTRHEAKMIIAGEIEGVLRRLTDIAKNPDA